ncbi:unnamed protein product [Closterium sp. Naga37s-1]|nr:unnamed protein product [Closterium sp. Naga37s-1]
MGNCVSCFRGDGEARAVKATGAAFAQQTDGAPQLSYSPSSVADHRAYQSAPLLRPRSLHPSEVVPVDPSPSPPPAPQAEELPRAPAASSGESRSPYDDSSSSAAANHDPSSSAAAAAAAYYDPLNSAAYYNSSFDPQAYRAASDSSSFSAAPPAQQPPPPAAPLLPASSSAESSLPAQISAMGSARDSASARTSAGLPPLREFSYAELRAATGGFSDLLGEGGFGQAEVEAMSALNHPNILRLEGVAMDMEQRPILVYELIPGGNVKNLLARVGGLGEGGENVTISGSGV